YRNEQGDGLTHYPGFSLEAVRFLVNERGVVGLGIDTMSVDMGATTTYPVHVFTSAQNVYHLENLANLASVPASGAVVLIAPIKMEKGSGAGTMMPIASCGTCEAIDCACATSAVGAGRIVITSASEGSAFSSLGRKADPSLRS